MQPRNKLDAFQESNADLLQICVDLTLSGSLAYTLPLLLSVMTDLGCSGALREQEW